MPLGTDPCVQGTGSAALGGGVDPVSWTPSHPGRGGGHDAEEPYTVLPGVPAADGGAGAVRAQPGVGAEEYEPSGQTIRNWLRQAGPDEGKLSVGLTTAEREELRRLKREVRTLREEREMLAKAAAYFARETGRIPSGSSSS